jgi:hypothetical protein
MASRLPPRQPQRGYLLEIPVMLFIIVLAVAILAPRLPLIGQKVLIGVAVVPILFCLFYMIVAPGWMPGRFSLARRVWRVGLFLGCAAAIIAGVGAFILR